MSILVTLEELAAQKAGRYLTWMTQSEGIVENNERFGTPDTAIAINGSSQLGKLIVNLSGNITASFRIQYCYYGSDIFCDIDNSDRINVKGPWSQQIDISGVDYVYVNFYNVYIPSGSEGHADVYLGKSVSKI
jgi:hypothetical protein